MKITPTQRLVSDGSRKLPSRATRLVLSSSRLVSSEPPVSFSLSLTSPSLVLPIALEPRQPAVIVSRPAVIASSSAAAPPAFFDPVLFAPPNITMGRTVDQEVHAAFVEFRAKEDDKVRESVFPVSG